MKVAQPLSIINIGAKHQNQSPANVMDTTRQEKLHADDGLQVAYESDYPEVTNLSDLEVVDPGKHQQYHELYDTDATSFHGPVPRKTQRQRILGLRKNGLWIIIIVLLLVVAGAVGGGVAGSKATKKSSERYLH